MNPTDIYLRAIKRTFADLYGVSPDTVDVSWTSDGETIIVWCDSIRFSTKDEVWRSTAELSCGVSQRRARQRPLSRLAPPFDSRFDEARLGKVMRQQLWLGRSAADHVIA